MRVVKNRNSRGNDTHFWPKGKLESRYLDSYGWIERGAGWRVSLVLETIKAALVRGGRNAEKPLAIRQQRGICDPAPCDGKREIGGRVNIKKPGIGRPRQG